MEDELLNMLALHAMDLLESALAADLEAHLADGCEPCLKQLRAFRNTFAAVAATVPLIAAPAHVRDRLMAEVTDIDVSSKRRPVTDTTAQVWKAWTTAARSERYVVRSSEREWEQVRAGVWAKRLYVDREHDTITMLVRMEAGASYTPHRHAGPEQCYVLEGDLRDGDLVVRSGDFQCAAEGSAHGAQRTQSGCLLLIVSSLRDELLA
jgi:anti-sigma factor ChrR (cupin superfamily)